MERIGQCVVCRQGVAKHNCRICGAHVCERCYDMSKGICIICKQGRTIEQ